MSNIAVLEIGIVDVDADDFACDDDGAGLRAVQRPGAQYFRHLAFQSRRRFRHTRRRD